MANFSLTPTPSASHLNTAFVGICTGLLGEPANCCTYCAAKLRLDFWRPWHGPAASGGCLQAAVLPQISGCSAIQTATTTASAVAPLHVFTRDAAACKGQSCFRASLSVSGSNAQLQFISSNFPLCTSFFRSAASPLAVFVPHVYTLCSKVALLSHCTSDIRRLRGFPRKVHKARNTQLLSWH